MTENWHNQLILLIKTLLIQSKHDGVINYDCVLKMKKALGDKTDCLKVFIHADIDFRARRIVEVYGESDVSPLQRLKEKDKRRATYHLFYTDKKWVDARNYDICLKSGVLGMDNCVILLRVFADEGTALFMNAIFTRRSIRKYQRIDVEEEKIRKILETGISAPSAGNQRLWEFYVVKNSDAKRKLSETSPFAGCAKDAPACFVLCYRKEYRYPDYAQID